MNYERWKVIMACLIFLTFSMIFFLVFSTGAFNENLLPIVAICFGTGTLMAIIGYYVVGFAIANIKWEEEKRYYDWWKVVGVYLICSIIFTIFMFTIPLLPTLLSTGAIFLTINYLFPGIFGGVRS